MLHQKLANKPESLSLHTKDISGAYADTLNEKFIRKDVFFFYKLYNYKNIIEIKI